MNTSNFKVEIGKYPSYLYALLNNDKNDSIVLIYKNTDLEENCLRSSENNKDVTNNTIDSLDITGSPLEVFLDQSLLMQTTTLQIYENLWTKEEEKYCPLTLQEARKAIENYVERKENKVIWCLCDGKDLNRVVLLSATQESDKIVSCQVNVGGYLPESDPTISFQNFCQKHFDTLKRIGFQDDKQLSLRQIACSNSHVYEIDTNNDRNVTLKIQWNLCTAQIPVDYSKCIMSLQTIICTKDSSAFLVWDDLLRLESYVEVLSSTRTLEDDDYLPQYVSAIHEQHLIDAILKTIENSQQQYRASQDEINKDIDLQTIVRNIGDRCTQDITDQLWIILTQFSTYGMLIHCLNTFFIEIANSNQAVYVSNSNKTFLAHMIRGITTGKLRVPRLTATQSLEIFIEIGLEKLRKDFLYIFTNGNILSTFQFDEIFQNLILDTLDYLKDILIRKRNIINLENAKLYMKKFSQLQTSIEMLLLVPSEFLQFAKKTIYDYYVGSNSPIKSIASVENKLQKIQVELPTNKIYNLIEGITPITQRFSLTTTRPNFVLQSVFHLSQRPIFPPRIYHVDTFEETTIPTEIYYHYTTLTKVTNIVQSKLK